MLNRLGGLLAALISGRKPKYTPTRPHLVVETEAVGEISDYSGRRRRRKNGKKSFRLQAVWYDRSRYPAKKLRTVQRKHGTSPKIGRFYRKLIAEGCSPESASIATAIKYGMGAQVGAVVSLSGPYGVAKAVGHWTSWLEPAAL